MFDMRRGIVGACAVLAAFVAAGAPSASAATAGPIHPGVQTLTAGAQCTANFIFAGGGSTYIGQAAHCSGTGAATDTNGCSSNSLPIGTPVTVTGASKPGTLVYNSWLTMRAAGETDANTCTYNDLALVKLDPDDVGKVDPSVPGFGGPTGVGGAAVLGSVFSYGNSSLRQGIAQLSPKQGVVVQAPGGGWSRTVLTVTPGIPGDSGSGFMNASGQAIGILSTLQVLPLPLSNGVGDLSRELAYMRSHVASLSSVQLVNGTKPFKANLLGAILGL
jgi:hypothetical protein